MTYKQLAAVIVALLIGLGVGRFATPATTAAIPTFDDFRKAHEAQSVGRYQMYQSEFYHTEERGWVKTVGTFRLDTTTGETSIYMAAGGNAGAFPGFWQKLDKDH